MDLDLDTPTTFDPKKIFKCIRASMVEKDQLKKHPVGVYFQNIAEDSLTGLAAIPYKEAEELGFFKVDFLHLSLLDFFENKNEIRQLLKVEPDWSMLEEREVVEKLFQIHNKFDIVYQIKPKNVQELADTIALIRPQKRMLLDQYIKNKKVIREELYKLPLPKGCFKKGHATSYALTIVLQLHLIKGGIIL